MRKFFTILSAFLTLFGLLGALESVAAPYPTGVGGTGTSAAPASGTIPIGNGSGSYTPALLHASGTVSVINASGSVTIVGTSPSGSGTDSQVTYWNGTALAGDPNHTWSSSTAREIIASSSGSLVIGTSTNAANALFTIATGTNILTVFKTGTVAIGTTTQPNYKLEVDGTLGVVGTLGTLSVNSGGNEFSMSRPGNNYIYASNASGTLNLGNATSQAVVTIDNNSTGTALAIKNNNVGIGTTSPAYKLEVAGGIGESGHVNGSTVLAVNGSDSITSNGTSVNLNFLGNNTFVGDQTFGNGRGVTGAGVFDSTNDIRFNGTSGHGIELFADDTSGRGIVIQKTTGNVGILTTAPAAPLQVSGVNNSPASSGTATNATMRVRGNGNGVLDIGNMSGGNVYQQVTDATNLATTYNLLLQPNGGNVAIGTTTPAYALTFAQSTSSSGGISLGGDVTLFRYAANTLAMRNGAGSSPQAFRLYNTYTDESNNEYLEMKGVAGSSYQLNSVGNGTGSARNLCVAQGGSCVFTFSPVNGTELATQGSQNAGSNPVLSNTVTWNNSVTTFDNILSTVTNTSSSANSNLLRMNVGGSDVFKVGVSGSGYFAGNVAIGTTTPATALETVGVIRASRSGVANQYIEMDNGASAPAIKLTANGAKNLAISNNDITGSPTVTTVIDFQIQGVTKARLDNNGNFSVGTTTASQLFVVNGTDATALINSTTTTAGVSVVSAGSANLALNTDSSGIGHVGTTNGSNFDIRTNNTAKITVTNSSGNVGIATTTADARLDVNGTVRFEGSSTVSMAVNSAALLAGACNSATTSISTFYTTSTAAVSLMPQVDAGDNYYYKAFISASGVLTGKVCAATAGTPATTTLNIKLLQ